MSTQKTNASKRIRFITVTGILGAMSTILLLLNFSVPFMPPHIKFDFSDLPALIATFSLGPTAGVAVCLIKNVINFIMEDFATTAGIGSLSNFILGVCFVLPAGFIYKYNKTRRAALVSALVGSFAMALIGGLISNYFIIYPLYSKIMPMEVIIEMYEKILPNIANIFNGANPLFSCLLIFNVPFVLLKGLCATLITFLIYKHISPIIKGNKAKR